MEYLPRSSETRSITQQTVVGSLARWAMSKTHFSELNKVQLSHPDPLTGVNHGLPTQK